MHAGWRERVTQHNDFDMIECILFPLIFVFTCNSCTYLSQNTLLILNYTSAFHTASSINAQNSSIQLDSLSLFHHCSTSAFLLEASSYLFIFHSYIISTDIPAPLFTGTHSSISVRFSSIESKSASMLLPNFLHSHSHFSSVELVSTSCNSVHVPDTNPIFPANTFTSLSIQKTIFSNISTVSVPHSSHKDIGIPDIQDFPTVNVIDTFHHTISHPQGHLFFLSPTHIGALHIGNCSIIKCSSTRISSLVYRDAIDVIYHNTIFANMKSPVGQNGGSLSVSSAASS